MGISMAIYALIKGTVLVKSSLSYAKVVNIILMKIAPIMLFLLYLLVMLSNVDFSQSLRFSIGFQSMIQTLSRSRLDPFFAD